MYSRVPNKRPVQISVLGRQFLKIYNRPVPYKRPGLIFFENDKRPALNKHPGYLE